MRPSCLLVAFLLATALACQGCPKPAPAEVMVSAAWPGASAEQVEASVTLPLERALVEVPGVARVRSTSMPDGCTVRLELEAGVEAEAGRIAVLEVLPGALVELPEGVEPVQITPSGLKDATPGALAWEAVIAGSDHAALEHAVPLVVEALSGVACAPELMGAELPQVPEVVVELDLDRVVALGVEADSVTEALRPCQGEVPRIEDGRRVRLRPDRCDPQALTDVLLPTSSGAAVSLAQVATLELRATPALLVRDDLLSARVVRVEGPCAQGDLVEALSAVPLPAGVSVELRGLP